MTEQNLFNDFLSDDDKSLKGAGTSLKFGLNTGKLEKFVYNPNSGKDGEPANAIDIVIKVGDREIKQKIFETTKVYSKKGGEITDTENEEYQKAFSEDVKTKKGLLTHYMKIFMPEDILAAKFKEAAPKNFVELFKFAQSAVEAGIKKAGDNTVDVFLQYQWNIGEGQTMTFLELPKNLKDGAFICRAIKPDGKWNEVIDDEGLHYVDDKNNIHKFKRTKNYLDSPKGKQQKIGGDAPSDMGGAKSPSSSTANGGGW